MHFYLPFWGVKFSFPTISMSDGPIYQTGIIEKTHTHKIIASKSNISYNEKCSQEVKETTTTVI